MAIKFVILQRRDDTSYHYKRYENNKFIKQGNGFYSDLTTSEEQGAWRVAVIEWRTQNDIDNISDKVKSAIQKVRNRLDLDDQQFPEKRSLVMPTLASVIAAAALGNCDDTYLQQLIEATGGEIPTTKNIIKYAFNSTISNLKIDLQILKYQLTSLGINSFITPVLDSIETICDTFFVLVDAIYDELLRMYALAFFYYKKACTLKEILTSDERDEFFQKLINELARIAKEVGQDIANYLYICFVIPIIQEILDIVRNMTQTSGDVWYVLLRKLQYLISDDFKALLSGDALDLLAALSTLFPLIGTLVGAILALQCSNEEETNVANSATQASAQMIAEAQGDEYTGENYFLDKINKNREELKNTALVYSYALDSSGGYSLYYTSNDTDSNNVTDSNNLSDSSGFPCQITMCEDIEPTDTSTLFGESNLRAPKRLIVEFSSAIKNLNTLFYEGQEIKIDDVIATIDGINVKSKYDCKVAEAYPTYFVADYTLPSFAENITDVNTFSDEFTQYITNLYDTQTSTTSPFEELVDKYQNASYVYSFIKDYISFFRFPELAQHTREYSGADTVAISTDEFVEKYEDTAEEIIEEFEEKIQDTFDSDYIKTTAQKGKIIEIKDKGDSLRENLLSQILTLYNNNPGAMTYCSKGRIQDFMLYSQYINYLYSDRFVYDEDNPYITELYTAITDFISIRSRIELNAWNLESLIEKFDELCDTVLYQYWNYDTTYYAKLKELFESATDTLISSTSSTTNNDPASSSTYKKVLDYLKTLTGYIEPIQQEFVYEQGTDINEILEQQSSVSTSSLLNQESLTLERQLKKIAYQFITLLKIENSSSETEYTSEYYINSETRKQLEALYDKSDAVLEHTEGESYSKLSSLYKNETILDNYIKELKTQISNEVVRLRNIVKKAVDWYYTYDAELTDCTIFEQYREIEWPTPTIIYKDNIQCDYFLFNIINKNFISLDELREVETPLEEVTSDIPGVGTAEQLNTSCLPMSQYGIDNIMYWLKYCTVATLVNCMMPIYWSTGLVLVGAPVLLPIVYIPICVVPGRVTTVIGIGLCGIMPSSMILFVNPSGLNGSILIPLNTIVDTLVKYLNTIRESQFNSIEITLQPLINSLDSQINTYKSQLQDIDYQIEQIKSVELDFKTNKALKKRKEIDLSMKVKTLIEKI